MDSKLLALIATLVLASSTYMTMNNGSEWEAYKLKQGKSYATAEEEAYRFAVYTQNMVKIKAHNAKQDKTYTKGENQFTDLSHEEFKSIYLKAKTNSNRVGKEFVATGKPVGSINWVTKGKVQVVKNQGQCGSCWAFSAVATTESSDAVFGSQLGDFSEQQLVDCMSGTCNGCGGGEMNDGVQYLSQNGICTEASYPYQGVNGTCQESSCTKSTFTITGVQNIQASVQSLMAACDKQPVSVGCDASQWSSYTGGIFSDCGTSIDHGILLAGYTSSYWLILNSWGTSFGENGYIRLAGNADTCGVCDSACVPTGPSDSRL